MWSVAKGILAALVLGATIGAAASNDYPSRPVRILVPYAAGGSSDTAARLVADALGRQLGTSVYIENRGGAGGLIGTELFLKEPPDGYTILLGAIGPLTIIPAGKQVSYDAQKDFIPLGCIWLSAQVLVVNPKLPVKALSDFVDYAKANPEIATIGSAGVGAVSHLTIELLKREAGIRITHVPFRSTGAAMPDLLGGQVDGLVGDATLLAAHVASGKLKAMAVASPTRAIALPDIPTMSEAGLPGVRAESWFGLVVSKATPAPIAARLQSALAAAQRDPIYLDSLAKQNVSAGELGPDSFANRIRHDGERWRAIMSAADIKF